MTRRANGEGTLFRRKDGRWVAAVYMPTSTGGRHRRYVYGRTREEARRKQTELLRQADRGVPVTVKVWKVGDYLPHWLEEIARPKVRDSTYVKYETFVRCYLVPALGRKRLERLSTSDVRAFLRGMGDAGKSPATVRVAYAVLRAALGSALREELVFRNVAALVDSPRVVKREFSPWSAAESRRFLSSTRGTPLYPAYVVSLSLGLRRGELLGLRWGDVDLDARVLHVRRQLQRVGRELRIAPEPKSHRRTVPLPKMCVLALRWHRIRLTAESDAQPDLDALVFRTRVGTPIEPRNFSRSFGQAASKASLRPVRLHDARHGCATLLAGAGVPPRVIMEILGHSQIGVTMNVYAHVTVESQREALAHMDQLLGGEG
ncbi:MAG: site-specific integrase [Propionibacteriales bacterium]|nr:site-specific integrase [Propionibacteriales bacterium]